jgi:hypothetical protein
MERLGSPPPDDAALSALDAGLKGAPTEDGKVPIAALGWWMRHWLVGPTRVRDAARADLAARRFALRLPPDIPERPGPDAEELEIALGGFPVTRDEHDFVTRLLRARDNPGGPVPDHDMNGDNIRAATTYGLGYVPP